MSMDEIKLEQLVFYQFVRENNHWSLPHIARVSKVHGDGKLDLFVVPWDGDDGADMLEHHDDGYQVKEVATIKNVENIESSRLRKVWTLVWSDANYIGDQSARELNDFEEALFDLLSAIDRVKREQGEDRPVTGLTDLVNDVANSIDVFLEEEEDDD